MPRTSLIKPKIIKKFSEIVVIRRTRGEKNFTGRQKQKNKSSYQNKQNFFDSFQISREFAFVGQVCLFYKNRNILKKKKKRQKNSSNFPEELETEIKTLRECGSGFRVINPIQRNKSSFKLSLL